MESTDLPDGPENLSPFEEVFQTMVQHAGARMVFGEPVSAAGRTIVPVAAIRYGFGGGVGGKTAEHQHGGGGGLTSRPLGVVEITASGTRFIPFTSHWLLLASIVMGVCIGWWAISNID